MPKRITYRQKLQYLGIGAVLLFLACYRFAIAKTIAEYKTYKQFTAASADAAGDQSSLQLLQNKTRMLDEIMSKFLWDSLDEHKNLLAITGDFCKANHLQLKEYKPFPVVQSDSIRTITRSITVQGGFIDCLHLLYQLETRSDVGRIGSVVFKSYALPGNLATALTCTVFIQNLIPFKNENN